MALVHYAYAICGAVEEYEEIVLEQIHLEYCFLYGHRNYREILTAYVEIALFLDILNNFFLRSACCLDKCAFAELLFESCFVTSYLTLDYRYSCIYYVRE